MMNEIIILLSRQNKLWIRSSVRDDSYPVPIKLIGLLGKAGYIMSDEIQGLISPEDEKLLLEALVPYLSESYGFGKRWTTVWTLPPEYCKSIQSELYANPDLLEKYRKNIPEFWETNNWVPTKILEPGSDQDLSDLSRSLLGSPLPISPGDMGILKWIFRERKDLVTFPTKIKVKEILALSLSFGFGKEFISGVTDILRVASWMSGSGALNPKIKFHLTKKDRRVFLGLLEWYLGEKDLKWCLQDAKKYKEAWKILASHCHPSPKTYPLSFKFFGEIKKGSLRSWYSFLQKAYDSKDYQEVLRLLSQRPSEFLRRYDSLVRKAWEDGDTHRLDDIQTDFMGISGVPCKVLFEVCRHLTRRNLEVQRSYFDKKGVRRFYQPLPPLPTELIEIGKANILWVIQKIWETKDTYRGKKVHLDLPEDIEFCLSFRGGLKEETELMYPGQKITFPTKGMIRFFLQWIDPDGTEDLDLHAWFISDDGEEMTSVSWNTSFLNGPVFHSGDIRHQQGDCSEWVTVDYSEEITYTWMLVTIQNYDGPKLSDVENWIGVSELHGDKVKSIFRGKVFSEEKNMSAFIVNLKEGWARLLLEGINQNVLSENRNLILGYITPISLDTKDLITRYVKSTGGIITDTEEESDITIGMSEYLSGEVHKLLLE